MRELIRMISSAGTGHFYTTDKNKRTTPDKLEKKMFEHAHNLEFEEAGAVRDLIRQIQEKMVMR